MNQETMYYRAMALLAPLCAPEFLVNHKDKLTTKADFTKKIYRYVNDEYYIKNRDELNQLIQFYYPFEEINSIHIFDQLRTMCSFLFTHNSQGIVVNCFTTQQNENDILRIYQGPEKTLIWYYVNQFITPDLLKAMFYVNHGYSLKTKDIVHWIDTIYEPVSTVENQLNKVLQKGLAETHIHLKGALPFEYQWSSLLQHANQITFVDFVKKIDFNPGIAIHESIKQEKYKLSNLFYGALIIYICLGWHCRINLHRKKTFDENMKILFHQFGNEGKKLHHILYQYMQGDFSFEPEQTLLDQIFEKLSFESNGFLGYRFFKTIVDEYNSTHEVVNNFKTHVGLGYEYLLLLYCCQYLNDQKEDSHFSDVFMQYCRIKNMIYRYVNQSRLTKGLTEFQDYFLSNKALAFQHSSLDYYRNIFDVYSYDNVRYLEIRIGHEDVANTKKISENIRDNVVSFCQAYDEYLVQHKDHLSDPIVKAGIIIHFNKFEKGYDEVCYKDYKKDHDKKHFHYFEYQEYCLKNLALIQKYRSECPPLADYIIGIDTASDELAIDPYVFAPIFKSTRVDSANFINYAEDNLGIKFQHSKEIGITYHVGEVHRSIVSGWRHVDEVVENFGFLNGERIGHGTVLGLEITDWVEEHPISILPMYELLENWLWIYKLKCVYGEINSLNVSFIKNKIHEIAKIIYNSEMIDVDDLLLAYNNQFHMIDDAHIPVHCILDKKNNDDWSYEELLYSKHCRKMIYKMRKPIEVDNRNFIDLFHELQDYLLMKLSKKGIIVETNPISNIKIGEFNSLFEHPILKLNSDLKNKFEANHVIATINTDDPGVFNTRLQNQFGYIEQSLISQGIPKEDILAWIDKLRNFGLDSTFITSMPKSYDQIREELREIIQYFDKEPDIDPDKKV